jgi:dihydrofolate reductase
MSLVVVGMTISLDGYINHRDRNVDRLYSGAGDWKETDDGKAMMARTGAVIMGRTIFEMGEADLYADHYEFQVPLFIVTHAPPEKHPKENENLTISFVTDGIESAVAQAKAAAKGKDVTVVGGANLIQQLLRAGLADELHVDIVPWLFGEDGGVRLFGEEGLAPVQLERIDLFGGPERTSLKYRIVK